MPDARGRFIKGEVNWRPWKPHREYAWLYEQYITKERSAANIAQEEDCTENAVLFWLRFYNIPRRTMKEIRSKKHWGLTGKANGMYGRRDELHPNWKGGVFHSRPQGLSEYQAWRKAVIYTWGTTCFHCGKQNLQGRELHAHHILSWIEYPDRRYDPLNGYVICSSCHAKLEPQKRNAQGCFLPKGGDE